MPNWAHNTLTVSAEDAGALELFVKAVKTDEQPLSFEKIVPQPSKAEYAAMEKAQEVDCDLCNGTGTRPGGLEEFGAWWVEWSNGCNGCKGTGRRVPATGGWYGWCVENWGTKWDAAFSGTTSLVALGAEGMDVTLTKDAQRATITPTVAVYKFDTAWSPPEPIIAAASGKYPELVFELTWAEAGTDAAGYCRVQRRRDARAEGSRGHRCACTGRDVVLMNGKEADLQSQCRGFIHPEQRERFAFGYRDEEGRFIQLWESSENPDGLSRWAPNERKS